MTRSATLQGTADLCFAISQCVCKRPFTEVADAARTPERLAGARGGGGQGACSLLGAGMSTAL